MEPLKIFTASAPLIYAASVWNLTKRLIADEWIVSICGATLFVGLVIIYFKTYLVILAANMHGAVIRGGFPSRIEARKVPPGVFLFLGLLFLFLAGCPLLNLAINSFFHFPPPYSPKLS